MLKAKKKWASLKHMLWRVWKWRSLRSSGDSRWNDLYDSHTPPQTHTHMNDHRGWDESFPPTLPPAWSLGPSTVSKYTIYETHLSALHSLPSGSLQRSSMQWLSHCWLSGLYQSWGLMVKLQEFCELVVKYRYHQTIRYANLQLNTLYPNKGKVQKSSLLNVLNPFCY